MKVILFKTLVFIATSSLLPKISIGQNLLETREGDPLYSPLLSQGGTNLDGLSTLIKLNISDQTLGIEQYFKLPKTNSDPGKSNKFWFVNAGIKAKPTEGYASVFRYGQFSPGTNISINFNRYKVFDDNLTTLIQSKDGVFSVADNFLDWLSLAININPNKYQLYKDTTSFDHQLYSKVFTGYGLSANYNIQYKSKFLFSITGSYKRKTNFSELDEIEVENTHTEYDPVSMTTRTLIERKTARLDDKFREFDDWNLKFAFTKLTLDGQNEGSIQFGFCGYIDCKFPIKSVSTVNPGIMLFLSQTKKYISTPVIALDLQISDFFDHKNVNNGLARRFSIGLTSVIAIR